MLKVCFKCQGLGHITSECPNRKVVDLVNEDEAKEDVEEVFESIHGKKMRRIVHCHRNLSRRRKSKLVLM